MLFCGFKWFYFILAAASFWELYWLARIFANSAIRSLRSLDFFNYSGAFLFSISCLLLITEVKFICLRATYFLSSQISTLLEPLRKYWPSLSCGSPRSCHHKKGPFWAHEVVSLLYLLIDCLNLIQLRNWHILLASLHHSMLTLEILNYSGVITYSIFIWN